VVQLGWKKLVILAVMVFCVIQASAQARVDSSGRPLLLMDDSLGWVSATLVYRAAGEEFYVPDLTRPDWIRSRYQEFAASGTFSVYVYAYHTSSRGLRGQLVEVSLEQKTAKVYDFANPKAAPTVLPLSSSGSPLVDALNEKIIPVVKKELLAHHQTLFGPPPSPAGTYSPATN
jgi:hypothetical protein